MSEEIKEILLSLKVAEEQEWHALYDYIEQLQQENKELKEKYSKIEDKYIHNVPCCNEDDCDLYKKWLKNETILNEIESLLEKYKKKLNTSDDFDRYAKLIIIEVLDRLKKLKESDE